MNVQLLAELNEVLESVTNGEKGYKVRALLLTGEGRGFCAGADLAERKKEQSPSYLTTGEGMAFNMTFRYDPLMKKLKNLPIPTISAINGVAAGGGLGLALTTDIAVAADTAKFVCVFVPRLGLVPDLGSTWLLPRLVGRARASAMAMLGDKISAQDAENWGLIWKTVKAADLMPTCMGLAKRLANTPSGAAIATRKLLDAATTHSHAESLAGEQAAQRLRGDDDDFMEGIMAFMQKRDPVFDPEKRSRL